MTEVNETNANVVAEPSATYQRVTQIPLFFGQPLLRGEFKEVTDATQVSQKPALFYRHPHGEIWVGDAIAWLRSLPSESVDLVFADPPYNIKKAEWDSFESQQAYVTWSIQ